MTMKPSKKRLHVAFCLNFISMYSDIIVKQVGHASVVCTLQVWTFRGRSLREFHRYNIMTSCTCTIECRPVFYNEAYILNSFIKIRKMIKQQTYVYYTCTMCRKLNLPTMQGDYMWLCAPYLIFIYYSILKRHR